VLKRPLHESAQAEGPWTAHLLVRTPSAIRLRTRRSAVQERYLIASGLIGDPVPPVMTSGGPQNMNS
jgi:hypothetical protein